MSITVGHGITVRPSCFKKFKITSRNSAFCYADVICNYQGYGNNSGFLCDMSHCILRREVCDGKQTCSSGVDES